MRWLRAFFVRLTLNETRILAVGVGGSLFFIAPLLGIIFGDGWVFVGILAACETAVAAVFAFYWPLLNWRTGLWFFLSFPGIVFASFFFSWGHAPINWQLEMRGLFDWAIALFGACVGGWLGARGNRLRTRRVSWVRWANRP